MMQRPDSGYSLVELLVVLALLGLMSLAMSGGMSFGARAWEKSGADVEALERMSGAQSLLRTLLQRVVPRTIDPNVAADPDLFTGTRDNLSFAAQSPSAFGAAGLARFQLRVLRDGRAQSLVLSWQSSSGNAARQQQILIEDARDIALAYATRDQNGVVSWSETWTAQPGAPALVMVRASFADGKKFKWPDLIVRPRIARDPTCIYDPVSFDCRHG
jgi:prepilin-type N-terminal cleavage/methylation domain-containing protein